MLNFFLVVGLLLFLITCSTQTPLDFLTTTTSEFSDDVTQSTLEIDDDQLPTTLSYSGERQNSKVCEIL